MNAERVELRPMVAADIAQLQALAREIWEAHYTPIIGSAQIQYMLEQRYCSEVLLEELRRCDLWWDLLVIGGEPVGYASYVLDDEIDGLKLDKLYVHPRLQRAGHGERMLERVLERARILGRKRVALAVNKGNPKAIAAYEKWMFRVERAVVKDIGGGFVMDDYIMVRDV